MVYQDFNKTTEDEKTSRINSAGLINANLENLWRDVSNAMCSGNLVLWNRKLDAIWVVLGGDVKTGDDNDKKFNEIDLKIYSSGSLIHKAQGFVQKDANEKASMSLQYLYLREKSLFLRRLQNSQGKGTAYASDDSDDFD